jgi:hypothetical protein
MSYQCNNIIGPFFSSDILNLERYIGQNPIPFIQNLCDEEKEYIFFQQDHTTTHTANNLLATLCDTSSSALLVHLNLLHATITYGEI